MSAGIRGFPASPCLGSGPDNESVGLVSTDTLCPLIMQGSDLCPLWPDSLQPIHLTSYPDHCPNSSPADITKTDSLTRKDRLLGGIGAVVAVVRVIRAVIGCATGEAHVVQDGGD